MPPETKHVVRQWIEKAENDLLTAVHTLGLGEECPTDTVGFHAHQCVEKYLKAVLSLKRIRFPKSHDLIMLTTLLPDPEVLTLGLSEQRRLTRYATITRYPGDYEPITLEEARTAIEMARRARGDLLVLLPAEIAMATRGENP